MAAASIEPSVEVAGSAVRDRNIDVRDVIAALRRHASDVVASLTGAVAAVPEALAASAIIGVAPIHGLYAAIAAPVVGGITARTSLLLVTATPASALVAMEVLRTSDGAVRVQALLLLTLLAGALQLVAAAAGLAKYACYVSHAVLTGFLMGVGALILLGQLGSFTGYAPVGGNAIAQTRDLLGHYANYDYATLGVGFSSLLLIGLTRLFGLKVLGPVVALALPALVVSLAGLTSVSTVGGSGVVHGGLPSLALPDFGMMDAGLATGALALAAIVFVLTAGVSQTLPDRSSPDRQMRDVAAAGAANVGSALFGGQPVGGSAGQSELNRSRGAQTRLAGVLSGLWILAFVLAFGYLIEGVAMASLAALLIVLAFGLYNFADGPSVLRAGWATRAIVLLTFAATVYLPVQEAVGLAALLCLLLLLVPVAPDVRVVEMVRLPDGGMKAQKPPERLPSGSVTILQVEGSLLYAGAYTLERRLPELRNARRPVVVLRLRGRTRGGAMLIDVLNAYARRLREHGGRLYVTGASDEMKTLLETSGKLALTGARLAEAPGRRGTTDVSSPEASSRWLVESRAET